VKGNQEIGVGSQETGVRRQETGDRRREGEGWRLKGNQEIGVRRQETGIKSQEQELGGRRKGVVDNNCPTRRRRDAETQSKC